MCIWWNLDEINTYLEKHLQITKMYIGIKKNLKHRSIHKLECIIRNFSTGKFQAQMCTWAKEKCAGMFIASLFVIAWKWKQPECLATEEWIDISRHSHTMETIQQRKWTNYYYTKPEWSSETYIKEARQK